MSERTVTISSVTAVNGKTLAGINSNYGDTATIEVSYSKVDCTKRIEADNTRTLAPLRSMISVTSTRVTATAMSLRRLALALATLASTPTLFLSARLALVPKWPCLLGVIHSLVLHHFAQICLIEGLAACTFSTM